MLHTTQKMKEIYEEIQKKLFYMIPEKWDKLYLYSSVIDRLGNVETGELFFYYIPRGILKKNPINVYEIPSKFNIEEQEYLKIVEILYNSIKKLRDEFKKTGQKVWSNLTISIENMQFKVEYNYDDLQEDEYTSYERHIIWRYKYLNQGKEYYSKEEKNILNKYLLGEKTLQRDEMYVSGIYIKNVKNIVDFQTADYASIQNVEYVASKNNKITKNQILKS